MSEEFTDPMMPVYEHRDILNDKLKEQREILRENFHRKWDETQKYWETKVKALEEQNRIYLNHIKLLEGNKELSLDDYYGAYSKPAKPSEKWLKLMQEQPEEKKEEKN